MGADVLGEHGGETLERTIPGEAPARTISGEGADGAVTIGRSRRNLSRLLPFLAGGLLGETDVSLTEGVSFPAKIGKDMGSAPGNPSESDKRKS